MGGSIDIMTEHGLSFDNVSYKRGDRVLFTGLSFTIKPGQTLWIGGENGIGKTSILRLAAGLTRANEGNIIWSNNGHDTAKQTIAYQGHKDALNDSLSVTEELEFWAELFEYDDPISAISSRIGLVEQSNVKTRHLSAGQKRRLVLGRLIISGRPIWIMDEPKAAMDRVGQNLIERLIKDHTARGGSVIAATHETSVFEAKNTRYMRLEVGQ